MTAPTTSTAPAPVPADTRRPTARPRLVPWLLRLHRPALCVWAGLVLVLAAALLWLWGPLTDAAAAAWRQYDACDMNTRCSYDQDAILRYKDVYNYTTLGVTALPFVVAAWSGAALFGRELENGTAHLAWVQSLSPTRWLAAKLALPAALVTTGTGLLVALHHLAWSAGHGKIDTAKPWTDDITLHANGPTTVAFALAGLATGALVGLLSRRTLPALALTLCVAGAVRGAATWVMPHLWPAVTHVTGLREGYSFDGLEVGSGLVTSTGAHIHDPGCGSTIVPECRTLYAKLDATAFYTEYHPYSHYWPLQLTTTALVLTIAALATAAAFTLLRRRTA
ncbi:ABC transporter permease [Streptomyces sp. NPDC020801]|uniref:ABC transporter permease n=1 Tax=unclassified Streptomyces TaxID=2593676 RepID=UPI0037B37C65